MILSPENKSIIYTPITLVLWSIGFVWLVAMLIYRRQKVTIHIEDCKLLKSSDGNYAIKMITLVSSRHPDILKKLKLGMLPEFPMNEFSKLLPLTINSVPKRMDVAYNFSSNILDEAMIKQNNEWDVELWIEATTSKSTWITDRFKVPAKFIRDGQSPYVELSKENGSLNKKTIKKR